MNFPFFIARRYLFSRKSTHAINVISAISAVGVAVATVALVIVLSAFNGFHDLVASLFTRFDAELEITPTTGKYAPADDPLLTRVRTMKEVEVATECVEDQALMTYEDRQTMVIVKGVDDNFAHLTRISDILYGDGEFCLHAANLNYGVLGIGLASQLGTTLRWTSPLRVYAPVADAEVDLMDPTQNFTVDSLDAPGVVFQVKQNKYDTRYVITPIAWARNLFGAQGMLTQLELKLRPDADPRAVQREMETTVGDRYRVRNRWEQQEDTFRIMQIEKFFAYIFLTFILIVACFNIVGSLSMLIIEKREDVATLRSLGATDSQIRRVFLFEGRLISLFGAVAGIGIGLLLCFLQQEYGLVRLGGSDGSFIVDAYPVSVHYSDILFILVTVVAVGWVAVWYPVRYMSRRLLTRHNTQAS